MSKPEIARDPTIDELLGSIRRAIHDDDRPASAAPERPAVSGKPALGTRNGVASSKTGPDPEFLRPAAPAAHAGPQPAARPSQTSAAAAGAVAISGSMRATRVSLEQSGTNAAKGRVTAQTDDFLALRERLAALTGQNGNPAARAPDKQPAPARPERAVHKPPVRSRGGLAGVLGGDVQLEEALARLNSAGMKKRPAARGWESAPVEQPPAEPGPEDFLPAPDDHGDAGHDYDQAPHEAGLLRQSLDDADDDAGYATGYDEEQPPASPAEDYEPYRPDEFGAAHTGYGEEAEDGAAQWQDEAGDEDGYAEPEDDWHEQERDWAGGADRAQQDWERRPAGHRQADAHPPGRLISRETGDAASAAFNRLADTIIAQATSGDRSMESITREILKPMLKSWLDHNLAGLVEDIIREEISRIARRGRR